MSTILAIGAWLTVLSILVQALQEAYKFLTNGRSRAFSKALQDFVGPGVARILERGFASELKVKGPLQFITRRPAKNLLPLDKEQLTDSLERSTSRWIRKTLENLSLETEVGSFPSPNWRSYLKELEEQAAQEDWEAGEVLEFLRAWQEDHPTPEGLRQAFLGRFAPHIRTVQGQFPQLLRNFEFAYRRQNLRLSFTLGFLLAVCLNLPFQNLVSNAKLLSEEQAQALASQAVALSERASTPAEGEAQEKEKIAREIVKEAGEFFVFPDPAEALKAIREEPFQFMLGCLLTSFLVSFGAPFWNDALKTLRKTKG